MKTEFTFYVAKQTISHLNIYKGDKFYKNENGNIILRKNGKSFPSWLNLDSEYFSVMKVPTIYNGGEVVKYQPMYLNNRPMFTGVVISANERIVQIQRDNTSVIDEVTYDRIKEQVMRYFFIDSKGKIQSDYSGKDVEVDKYRKKVGNFYETKELAREARNKIG